jgi:hypothetical protein
VENHDRLTSDKDEDTDGGAADLNAWLELAWYRVSSNGYFMWDWWHKLHITMVTKELVEND